MFQATASAAAAALLLLTGCASGEAALRQDVTSLRAEIRTLQRENGDLTRRVEAMGSQLDLLAVRPSQGSPLAVAEPPAAPAPLVPSHLKVVRLEQPKAAPARTQKSPAVPTATPIPAPGSEAQASLDAARALT
ncbi:MAG: hypothetical protein NTY18_08695, partial [Deltaproteobacteria bacterium]|nr:hypothetical protein [Deltaproteobacteria bacterium]